SVKSGTERFQYVLGAARREGGDFESGDGQEFSSGYTRVNVLAKGRLFTDAGILTFLTLPSWTDDIEKASSDAVTRPTLYPEERHQTYMVDWQNGLSPTGFSYQLQGWYHPNSLITQDEQLSDGVSTSRDVVYNDTDDYGIRFRIGKTFQENWTLWTGVDHFGRTDINARQESFQPSATGSGFDLINSFDSIQNGSYLDTGIFLTGNGRLGKLVNNAGVRVQRVATENNVDQKVSDSEYSWSANYGTSYPLSESWDAVFNVGRGIRPATISEKFFTGATGRGSITGNPNLVTESNLEFDGGVRYHWENGSAGLYVFHNDIEDFIARVGLEDGSFTYFNLPEVRIYGVEGEGYIRWNRFRFYGNFHDITGKDGFDANVNDIPPSRLIAGIEYEPGKHWGALFEIVTQFEKNDPGPDELARDSAFLITLKGDIEVYDFLTFRISGLNLTNETYFDSADNRAPLAIGRNIGFELLANF
ncbi:TonB-dependent receptor, partial [bacterium]|nr:TonB-dependent receptor [bacterium]